jgi:hypothetical protein
MRRQKEAVSYGGPFAKPHAGHHASILLPRFCALVEEPQIDAPLARLVAGDPPPLGQRLIGTVRPGKVFLKRTRSLVGHQGKQNGIVLVKQAVGPRCRWPATRADSLALCLLSGCIIRPVACLGVGAEVGPVSVRHPPAAGC